MKEMTPEVKAAIGEILLNFPDCTILQFADGEGGAYVIVDKLQAELSATYLPHSAWIGFHITQACPYADVYPHFVSADLKRADGKVFGEPFSTGHVFPPQGAPDVTETQRRAAIQISRRANRRDNASRLETPYLKLRKVLKWLNSQ